MNKLVFVHKDILGDTVEVFELKEEHGGHRFYIQTRGQPWLTAEAMTEMAVAMTTAAFQHLPTDRPKDETQ